ncbi:MAG TPA: hypothetical protein ENI87_12280, partial [bacterium]|nr:hypothetical protein [bacterium]
MNLTAAKWVFVALAAAWSWPAAVVAQQPAIVWRYAPAGAAFAGVLHRAGGVYALDRSGHVHALDADTGKPRWRSRRRRDFDRGFGLALGGSSDRLFVGCDDGLVAIADADGEELWHAGFEGGAAGPVCVGELVVAGCGDGKLRACRQADGELVWEHDFLADRPDDPPGFDRADALFGPLVARPGRAASNGALVALPVFDQCRVVVCDARTGARRWSYQTNGWVGPQPAFGPRNVYVGSQDGRLYALDQATGKESWHVETRGRVSGAAAPGERFVYFGSCDARLYAVDLVVGRVDWQFEVEHQPGHGAPIYSKPLILDDVV